MRLEVRFCFCLVLSLLLGGMTACDQSETADEKDTDAAASPYSVWASARKITPYELADNLKKDPAYADGFCARDGNRPASYSTHFALISTHETDRVDLIAKYEMDPSKPILYGDTGQVLAANLGRFVAQEGTVSLENEKAAVASNEELKLTFSEGGRFSGYCESTFGYTHVIQVDRAGGEMKSYSMHCSQPAAVVCMSLR